MSTTERPMPDFAEALERHLRHAALEHTEGSLASAFPLPEAPSPDGDGRARVPGRPAGRRGAGGRTDDDRPARQGAPARRRGLRLPVAAGSLAVVAVVVALALVLSGSGPATPRALGEPLVLDTPLVTLPEAARPGTSALGFLGPEGARITEGHAFPVDGGTAYLYRNDKGVCLTVPDAASDDPELERGVTCVSIATFRRFGIGGALVGEDEALYVAAIPDGAEPPTVSVDGGLPRKLRPSDIGVVTYRITAPTLITRFGPGDATTEERFLQDAPSTTEGPGEVPGPGDVGAPGYEPDPGDGATTPRPTRPGGR